MSWSSSTALVKTQFSECLWRTPRHRASLVESQASCLDPWGIRLLFTLPNSTALPSLWRQEEKSRGKLLLHCWCSTETFLFLAKIFFTAMLLRFFSHNSYLFCNSYIESYHYRSLATVVLISTKPTYCASNVIRCRILSTIIETEFFDFLVQRTDICYSTFMFFKCDSPALLLLLPLVVARSNFWAESHKE